MDRLIDIGDSVKVYWSYSDTPDTGIVKHIPSDSGDMWHIDMEGDMVAINPSCKDLQAIVRESETTNGTG